MIDKKKISEAVDTATEGTSDPVTGTIIKLMIILILTVIDASLGGLALIATFVTSLF